MSKYLEINKFHLMKGEEGMLKMKPNSADLIFTSPPYNMTKRTDGYNNRYEEYDDFKEEQEYIDWMVEIFNCYDKVLKQEGVVAFNLSYSNLNPSLPYKVINEILQKTNFEIADTVVWEKNQAIPNTSSKYRLTRICEFVYIFVKKGELNNHFINKEVSSVIEKTGQKMYKNYFNKIKAANNDGSVEFHKATFSTELADYFITLYSPENGIVVDNFMGTGTTAVSAFKNGRNFVGFEITEKYVNYSEERFKNFKDDFNQTSNNIDDFL